MSGTPRQPGQSSLDAYPEIPFSPEWGKLVQRARIDKGMSQDELAAQIGCDQPMISFIENGKTASSRAVVPLIEALGIPPPRQYIHDELDQRWLDAGRILRRVNMSVFRALLNSAEQAIAESEPEPD